MGKYSNPADPRGLIHEAYNMDIGPEDCRTIFLDWALGNSEGTGVEQVSGLLNHYQPLFPDHPMNAVLREGLERITTPPRRKGGWRGKRGNT